MQLSASQRSAVQARRAPCPLTRTKVARFVPQAVSDANVEQAQAPSTRRQMMLGAAALLSLAGRPQMALAAETATEAAPYTTFLGYATPPTSYGGYGGNAKESAKYTFEYPTGWKEEVPSKVEKGTQGIDGRVVNPRVKGQRAFVISLGRAGEDDKSFILRDTDQTFQGFAGADYDLQDALSNATEVTKDERNVDGIAFYTYDIDSPEVRYLASIAVKSGKVFALFVKTPAKAFRKDEAKLRHIIDTFKLL